MMNFNSIIRDRFLFSVSFVFTLFASLIYYYAAHHYFDLSDEGLQAYLLSFGSGAVSHMQFHHYAHEIGTFLWGNNLLSYRMLLLLFNAISSAILSASIFYFFDLYKRGYLLRLITYFNFIFVVQICFTWFTIVSYQSSAALAASLWVSANVLILPKRGRFVPVVALCLLSVSILLGLMAKLSTGFALVLGTIVFCPLFFYLKNRVLVRIKLFCGLLSAVICGIAIFGIVLGQNAEEALQGYAILSSSGSHSLLLVLARHIRDFVCSLAIYFPVYILFWYVLFKLILPMQDKSFKHVFILRYILMAIVGVALLGYTFSTYDIIPQWIYSLKLGSFPARKILAPNSNAIPTKIIMFLISLAMSCIVFKHKQHTNEKDSSVRDSVIVLCLCVLGALASVAGTNVHLIFSMRSSVGLVAVCAAYFILFDFQGQKFLSRFIMISFLLFVAGSMLFFYRSVYASYFRSAPLEQQIAESKKSSFLRGVKIEQDKANLIDDLVLQLEKQGFSKKDDKIFVTPASPGFLAAAGALNYGFFWPTGKNLDLVIKSFLAEEVSEGMRVFVLRGIELKPEEKSAFLSKVTQSDNFKSVKLGSIRNRREGLDLSYYLDGPYVKK